MHRLSIREKREFYAGLARLIRSGSALPTAIELLARDTPRGLGDFLRALNDRIKAGEPLGEALLHQRPKVTALEASIVTAASRGGKLDRGCDQLARYFDALDRARGEMTKRLMYPVLLFHFGIFVVNIRYILDGPAAYFSQTLWPLLTLYGFGLGLWFLWSAATDAARYDVRIDRTLRMIPGIGPVREKFALARFFATLDAQLEAGVNIWEAFANAAKTSDSARLINAAREAMPMLQKGERLSEALAMKKVIPAEYVRTFRVAEQAGELDAELAILAQRTEETAVAALQRWSEWLPRLIYGMVLLYSGYQIVRGMQSYVSVIQNLGQP